MSHANNRMGSLTNALAYVYSYSEYWRETPGAIEWAKRSAHTYFIINVNRETREGLQKFKPAPLRNYNIEIFRGWCEGGIYPNQWYVYAMYE